VPYYQEDLALVHHRGFGFHAELCAPGILKLLEPVLDRRGLVVELGCGSGLLTRYLLDAGHQVVATDASPAMLDLARTYVPEAERIEQLTLPDDPIPEADAVVSVGHVLRTWRTKQQSSTLWFRLLGRCDQAGSWPWTSATWSGPERVVKSPTAVG